MRRMVVVLGVWLAGGIPAWADWDPKDIKFYGKCNVVTGVIRLTGEENHIVSCSDGTSTDMTYLAILFQQGSLDIIVSQGTIFHLDDSIPLTIQIDQGPVIRRAASWLSQEMRAELRDEDLAVSLLNDLARGKRAVIKVGDEEGTIRLSRSAAAIEDFRQRVSRTAPVEWW